MVCIVGGPTALIETLAERVGSASIRTNALVVEVCKNGPDSVTIRLDAGETISAHRGSIWQFRRRALSGASTNTTSDRLQVLLGGKMNQRAA